MRLLAVLIALLVLPQSAPADWRTAPQTDWQAIFNGIPCAAQLQTRSKEGPTILIRCPSFLRQR
jgi:hypothetical protein